MSHTLRKSPYPKMKLASYDSIAKYSAATKQEISKSGVTVASLFFKNVFGTEAQKALSAIVALR